MMRFIDFFAGIGGMRRGLEKAGHKAVGWCEWDKYARQSYEAIHNTEGEWTAHDIRTVRAGDLPRADLWAFGFPCTDISVAGKMQGFRTKGNEDEETTGIEEQGEQTRSGLFYEIIRLLRELPKEDRPEWLLCENVKNLLSIERGWGFARCIVALGEVGYNCEWQVFNTKFDYNVAGVCVPGIPQNRERIYLVGRLTGKGRPGKVFPIARADKENPAQLSQIGKLKTQANCEEQGVSATDRDNPQRMRVYDRDGLAPALHTMQGGGLEPLVTEELKVKQIGHIEGYKLDNPQAYRVYDESGASPTLTSAADGKVPWVVDDMYQGREPRAYKNECPTLRSERSGLKVVDEIVTYNVQQKVKVRKYDVDVPALQECLRDSKKKSGKTNADISKELDLPITRVEHWFRTDNCFAIPDAEVWLRLKDVIGIDTNDFDESVTEFIEMDNQFDQANRVYGINGIAPTLTRTKSDIQVVGNYSPSGYNATRVVSPDGIAPTVMENHGQVTAVTVIGGNTPCVSYRAVLTPDREEKRQNGRRIKEDGEPMFTLTTQDKHGVLIEENGVEVLGGIYTGVSPAFNRGILPDNSRCLKANSLDAGVAILTKERTEYGKEVRKAYESGELQEQRKNMTQYVARTDGMSNTITTVEKDNYLLVDEEKAGKPYIIDNTFPGREPREYEEYSPTLRVGGGGYLVGQREDNQMPKVVGGVGEPNAFGKQFRQGNRIYSTETVAPALQANNGNTSGGSILIAEENE